MGLLRAFVFGTLAGAFALAVRAAPVVVLDVQDAIGPGSADYVVHGLATAAQRQAPMVVIRLDTPGGLDTAMRSIIQAILASPVPVAVYVSPQGARAASAGTYMLYAAHVAAMSPATTLGAATPVAIGMPQSGGGDAAEEAQTRPASAPSPSAGDAMSRKAVSDAAAFIRGLAQRRGRNADWAEQAVREAVSLTADEALRQHVIDVVADDVDALLESIDGRTVRMRTGERTLKTRAVAWSVLAPDWRQRTLSVITNPSFALILMMIGVYGLIFEFSSPGFGIPGTVGAICLLLALFAFQLLPVNYAGLALIALGMLLVAAELVTPAFGVLGIGGVAALFAGGVLLFDRDIPGFGVPLWLIFGLSLSSAATVLVAGRLALRAHRRPVLGGREEWIGTEGVVLNAHGAATWAEVHGERWQVACPDVLVPGQRVRVIGSRGLVLDVLPVNDSNPKGAAS